jgi:4'-phosphopantetheinyl transferase
MSRPASPTASRRPSVRKAPVGRRAPRDAGTAMPDPFRLGPHDVHVWSLRLDLPQGLHERLARVLSDAEASRAARFVAATDRRRHVAARALLRCVLAGYAGTRPESVAIASGPGGKPRLADRAGPHFNLSHAGPRGLLAVSAGREVGVDLERITSLGDLESLARVCCSPGERAALRSGPEAARTRAFLEGWTRKEACLKALGVGLAERPDRVDPWTPDGAVGRGGIAVRALAAGPGHVAALAVEAGPVTVRRRTWRLLATLVAREARPGRSHARGPGRSGHRPAAQQAGSGSRLPVGEGAS